ncbi:MAG: GDSL-type esterase/lipase family protein [Phycisphaeraceae bacterium]
MTHPRFNQHAIALLLASALAFSLVGCAASQGDACTNQVCDEPSFLDPVPPSASTFIPDKIVDTYWHGQYVRVNKEVASAKDVQVVFFGDSITKGWSMLQAKGKPVWDKQFAKYNPINMGNSGGITPTMLYRATQGNLDFPKGQAPDVAVLLCGTNNYGVSQSAGGKVQWDLGMKTDPREVADGVRAIAQTFRSKLPGTRVIVLAILPVKQDAKWIKVQETNRILAEYNYPKDEVVYLDLKNQFTDAEGKLKPNLFTDGTHLTTEGYQVMADAIQPEIDRLIKLGPVK